MYLDAMDTDEGKRASLVIGPDFLPRRNDIMRLLRTRTVPLDLAAAFRAGEIAAAPQRSGQVIGQADCLQAGICLRHDLPLAARHRKHFSRVADRRLVDL